MVLSDHIKLYKYIYFYTYIVLHSIKLIYTVLHLHISYYTLTLARSVNKIHYGIYTYMEGKSQTIYMHDTEKKNPLKS